MLSIPHLIIVFIVALVVFGPEKLPELARNLGKIMGEFKRATGDLRSTFEGHLRDLERETDQRRMRNESETAATASSSIATPAELPPAPPVPGIVSTTPPHILGAGAPYEAPVSSSESSSSSDPSPKPSPEHSPDSSSDPSHEHFAGTAAPAEPPKERQDSRLEPGHNPETLTDAGIHST